MPTLSKIENRRLCLVSEMPDANGNYTLEDFEHADFNQEFPEGQIYQELQASLELLWDGGSYYQINDDAAFEDDNNIQIDIGDGDCLVIPDIRDQIESDLGMVDFYVLVDRSLEEFRWVVCMPYSTVFRG